MSSGGRKVCFDFLERKCTRGKNCKFSHEGPGPSPPPMLTSLPPRMPTSSACSGTRADSPRRSRSRTREPPQNQGPPPSESSGSVDAVGFIKKGATLSYKFKRAWTAYARRNGNTVSDPAKFEADYLKAFADWLADLAMVGLGGAPVEDDRGQSRSPSRGASPHPSRPSSRPSASRNFGLPDAIVDEIERLNNEADFEIPIDIYEVREPLAALPE